MSTLTPAGVVLKDVDLIFDADPDNYGAHADVVRFDPSTSQVTFPGMAPVGMLTDQSEATWTLTLNFVQDWTSAKSLSRYLYEHAGEAVTVKFKPRAGTGAPSFSSTVTLAHGPIGGNSQQFAAGGVTMGCTRPVLDSDDNPVTPEA